MFGFFKKKPLLSEEVRVFQFNCYKWLLSEFGGPEFYENTQLVLPSKQHFPVSASSPELLAIELFEKVKFYSGMEEWPCRLEAQEEDPDIIVAPTTVLQGIEQNPLGTFEKSDEHEIVITYNPKLTADPMQLIATFAHELSHYLTITAQTPPPGGIENWEFATDICSSFLGFGIFAANATFNFKQYTNYDSQGWQTSGGGYLSEQEHSYALAIFMLLKDIPIEQAYSYCDTNIKSYLKRAYIELEGTDEINLLKGLKYENKSHDE